MPELISALLIASAPFVLFFGAVEWHVRKDAKNSTRRVIREKILTRKHNRLKLRK